MPKHTPGPWQNVADCWIVSQPLKGANVAIVSDRSEVPGETRANATLLAAAPDLLAVAEAIVEWADIPQGGTGMSLDRAVLMAREAIKKAKGE